MLLPRKLILMLTVLLGILVTALLGYQIGTRLFVNHNFDGNRAYQDVAYQVSLGPRTPRSEAHSKIPDYVASQLGSYGWEIDLIETTYQGQPVRNITATRGSGDAWVLLGAHYDSRLVADNDPDPINHDQPVPGANDGASGVAVLLELGRTLPENLNMKTTLLFIDSEDQGRIQGWDWILGSSAYVETLTSHPNAVIIVDMIGDSDLNIFREHNSDPTITAQIWKIAKDLGYGKFFIDDYKYKMLDDHIPFKQLGIPAVDIIDFDYPYWHTISDTLNKVSPQSLEAVGKTLYVWLSSYNQQ